MTEEELIELERELRQRFIRLGVPELAADENYRRRLEDGESGSLLPTRERVASQLEALERVFALYDRDVYRASLDKIRALIDREAEGRPRSNLPSKAVIILARRESDVPEFDLGKLPRLRSLRARTLELSRRIREE